MVYRNSCSAGPETLHIMECTDSYQRITHLEGCMLLMVSKPAYINIKRALFKKNHPKE